MSKIVQEKFQAEFSVPYEDGSNSWASDKSARVKKGTASGTGAMFGSIPVLDIQSQELADIRQQREVMPGETDVSYDCPGPGEIRRGFFRKKMSPTDDLYTNEHVDLFYGEVKLEVEDGEKEVGFLERGNMLDRL